MTINNIYNYQIEQDLLDKLVSKIKLLTPSSTIILCDKRVYSLYKRELQALLLNLPNSSIYHIKSSEKNKNLTNVSKIYNHLLKNQANRHSLIIAIGGGIVGDIATFVASNYYRGLKLMIIPTTLISMVDSCLGGKGGVNFKDYKNIVGCFYPAQSILIDPTFLKTLSLKQLKDGFAEIVKYAFLFDEKLFKELENLDVNNFIENSSLIIVKCLELKANIVNSDLNDQGERQKLNFGHTIGHAIEKASLGKISHGQAVAMGMVLEHKIMVDLKLSDINTHNNLISLLKKLQIYKEINKKYAKTLTYHILHDKKSNSKHSITMPYVEKIATCKLQSFNFKDIINIINTIYQ